MSDNPYIARGPVRDSRMFFGREHEIEEIAAFVRGNQSVSIVGSRKIGKTSLLFRLGQSPQLDDGTLFCYIDCESLGDLTVDNIFGQLAFEINETLQARDLPGEPALTAAIAKPGRMAFENAIRKLNQRNWRIVLALDEFERLSTNPNLNLNFFNALRSAAGRYQLVFLTASAHPLIQLTYSGRSQDILSSPFFNIFAPLFLGLLSPAQAEHLITRPAAAAGRPFPPVTQQHIYELAGGHPLALQIACFHAFNKPTDLDEIERHTQQELEAHFEYYWRNLSPTEQRTLLNLSQLAVSPSTDTEQRMALRNLIQKSLVLRLDNGYRLPSKAWEKFLSVYSATVSQATSHGERLAFGTRLSQYQILENIGRGGMAEVYRARHTRLERIVAVKILTANLAGDREFRNRFEREAQAVAALQHPGIVQVYDFGDSDGIYYMVMEYLAGRDLAYWLRERGTFSLAETTTIIQQVASALDYAHQHGVVHRDIKPSNVMLDPTVGNAGRPVLTDFGIAKIRGSQHATRSGLLGTVDYIAPEQIDSGGEVDHRADIYSLGVMTFQMLTGRLPFENSSAAATLMAHLQQPPPDPRHYLPQLPQPPASAILQAMSKNRAHRFAAASQFAVSLLS